MTELSDAQRELARLFADSHDGIALTGAGISTESGIPDFRSPGGLWTRNKPIPFDAFCASAEARAESWRRRLAMEDVFAAARPSTGHKALTALTQAGVLRGVITQNIDNLHQDAGLVPARLIEIHGNTRYATCIDCGLYHSIDSVAESFAQSGGQAPECLSCRGRVKTATISFGQAMPEHAMTLAVQWAQAADLFLCLGSSLTVYPAANLPLIAARSGATLVIINREETPLDGYADLVVRAEIGEVLAPFVDTGPDLLRSGNP